MDRPADPNGVDAGATGNRGVCGRRETRGWAEGAPRGMNTLSQEAQRGGDAPRPSPPRLGQSEPQGGSRRARTRAHEETKNPHACTEGRRQERARPSQYRKVRAGGTR